MISKTRKSSANDGRGTWDLPIRIGYWEDEEVEHIQEGAVLRVRNEAVHHEGHRGRADPLSGVNSSTFLYFQELQDFQQQTSFYEYGGLRTRLPSFSVSETQ